MRFYDRKSELALLQDNERQSFETAVFTVLMGLLLFSHQSLFSKSSHISSAKYLSLRQCRSAIPSSIKVTVSEA